MELAVALVISGFAFLVGALCSTVSDPSGNYLGFYIAGGGLVVIGPAGFFTPAVINGLRMARPVISRSARIILFGRVGASIIQGIFRLAKDFRPITRQGEFLSGVQSELTDPFRFIIGAIMIVGLGPRTFLAVVRMSFAFWVSAAAATAPVLGVVLTGLSPLAYALTVFLGGLATLIPERLYDLRREKLVRGSTYPFRVKGWIIVIEVALVVGGIGAIVLWKFGGPGLHTFWRGVTWGLLTVAIADLVTSIACAEIGVAKSIYNQVQRSVRDGQPIPTTYEAARLLSPVPAVLDLSSTSVVQAAAGEAESEAAVQTDVATDDFR